MNVKIGFMENVLELRKKKLKNKLIGFVPNVKKIKILRPKKFIVYVESLMMNHSNYI